MSRPVVILHGYSDKARSLRKWKAALTEAGHKPEVIRLVHYETLTNEIWIRDLGEAFERALKKEAGLDDDEEFDAIVHSTGMLVVRAWLAQFASAPKRLQHLIGLAPASFGSPLAHKGRSFLGALFKGRKELGADFLEAGDGVLYDLELASTFLWDLAHEDALANPPVFGPNARTPWVFTFCGNETYKGIRQLVNEPGTDGTVLWAGCSLDARKITIDLTRRDRVTTSAKRIDVSEWVNARMEMVPVGGVNHGTILSDPPSELVEMVVAALEVDTKAQFEAWWKRPDVGHAMGLREGMEQFQQFVVRLLDDRGDPVTDWNMQLYRRKTGSAEHQLEEFDTDVHVYSRDASYRSFHVNLSDLQPERLETLWMSIAASTGTALVQYEAWRDEGLAVRKDPWIGTIDLTPYLRRPGKPRPDFTLFHPFTTTLVDIRIDRDPVYNVRRKRYDILWFG
ncbi:MAG: alpha/beta hydrolase [Acidobacteria bacterium]|nr:alpha/beta hydrolase [Acidobacteriota bacterium]